MSKEIVVGQAGLVQKLEDVVQVARGAHDGNLVQGSCDAARHSANATLRRAMYGLRTA